MDWIGLTCLVRILKFRGGLVYTGPPSFTKRRKSQDFGFWLLWAGYEVIPNRGSEQFALIRTALLEQPWPLDRMNQFIFCVVSFWPVHETCWFTLSWGPTAFRTFQGHPVSILRRNHPPPQRAASSSFHWGCNLLRFLELSLYFVFAYIWLPAFGD